MAYFPQTRSNDAVNPDELVRLSQVGTDPNNQSMAYGFFSAFFNNHVNHFYNGQASTTDFTIRRYALAQAGTMTRFNVIVRDNNNSIDGAAYTMRVNQVKGNETMVVDQATGTFQDITNSDVYAVGDEQDWIYEQGNSWNNTLSMAAIFTP